MKQDPNYDDYLAHDAAQHLTNILSYFFSDHKNAYEHALAKQKYNEYVQRKEFITSLRVMHFLTGTSIVQEQLVGTYQTTQGWRYKIKKTFTMDVNRFLRLQRRTQDTMITADTPKHQNKSPHEKTYGILRDSSDEESSKKDSEAHNTRQTPKHEQKQDIPPSIHVTTNQDDDSIDIDSEVTKHTEKLKCDMDNALESLKEETVDGVLDDTAIQELIQNLLEKQIQPIHKEFDKKNITLNKAISKYNELNTDLETTLKTARSVRHDYTKIKEQINTTLTFI